MRKIHLCNGRTGCRAVQAHITISAIAAICLLCIIPIIGAKAQTISTIAGNGFAAPYPGGFAGDGGPATAAELSNTFGVACDKAGNIYIADLENNRIRKVDTGGIITTIAGNGTGGYSGDGGQATAAELNAPSGVAADTAGNIYIVDANNQCIRLVNRTGVISTVAGNGTGGYSGDGGPATAAELNGPSGVAADMQGNIYIADYWNNRIRKVNSAGTIYSLAGNGIQGYSGDGGLALSAELDGPAGVAADKSGNVFIADEFNECIRKINSAGIISTVAGNGINGFSGDRGPATAAELYNPAAVATDTLGNFYIADFSNERIRKVSSGDSIYTLAGNGMAGFSGDGGAAAAAELDAPNGVAAGLKGAIFIADGNNNRIRKVTAGAALAAAGIPGQSMSLTVYPNPASGMVYIRTRACPQGGFFYAELCDMFGTVVYKQQETGQTNLFAMDVSQFAAGIYFVQVVMPDATYVQKVVVIH